jgi:hypothetical protein
MPAKNERNMNLRFKLDSLVVLALALVFYWFFMFTKHDPPVSAIIPFGDDPYDSVGSFCMIISLLLAALSLVRSFRTYRPKPPAAVQCVFLVRTQIAIPIGILATLVADAIAMARHPAKWTGKPATGELLELMAALAALSISVLLLVRRSTRGIELPAIQNASKRALFTSFACAAVLALFPEAVIQSVFLHFLAIVLGFVLIAAPQADFALALLPYDTDEIRSAVPPSRSRLWIQWGSVTLLGIAIGAMVLMEEIVADGAAKAPFMQVAVVSSMFIGAGTALLLVAFAFYKKPLGLFRKTSQA